MRTQLELWKIVKENFEQYFLSGLCGLIYDLTLFDIINTEEKELLKKELSEYGDNKTFFIGFKYAKKPRLEFIDKMIKKHSENAITENK